ncbi:choice-of-anchor D domain-containing protein [Luteolibacter arcticus]|uniref:Choice-of-anchor D domain-containing protein n=1 Tax=Luteolibacter arcticus TaxID=1581411 RepID=A0ABT3GHQ8_9BACT|nr:choice-of-anchor D domain-containing protein [Luteolibacter arcticus]MCW1922884.1 choice-of-anchor D domain-containing protein [Luteolibacter arcticus]
MACVLLWMSGTVDIAPAQVPNTLRHSLYAPKTAPQKNCGQGACVALDGGLAVVGAPMFDRDEITAPDCGAVRIHEVATGLLRHEFKSPTSTPFGYFGQAVAISGDHVVVGSDLPVGGEARAGQVHIFDLASPSPSVPLLTLTHPDPAADDLFGHSVAIHGNIVVVGVWLDDDGAENAGSAFVYDLSSTTPAVPILQLANPSPEDNDSFGVAVGVYDSRIVVAAYGDDTVASNAGAAYVFNLQASSPELPVATLTLPAGAQNDCFGNTLSVSGSKVAIGVEGADAGATNAGKVAIFDLTAPATPTLVLTSPSAQEQGYFGTSVSLNGNRLVVGEYRKDLTVEDAGVCHVYDLASGTPTHLLKKVTPETADFFGNAVAVAGNTVLIGAFRDDTGDDESGSSYLFDLGSGTPLVPTLSLNSPVTNSADHFGAAVALSGDLVVVGAPESESGAAKAGRIRLFDLASSDPKTPLATIENPFPAADDAFGAAVAISGTRFAAGAPGEDTGALNAGCVYIFNASSPDPAIPQLVVPNPEPSAGDGFGKSVALSGNLLIVGVAADDGDGVDSGRAYVFNLAGFTPTVPSHILTNPGPAAGDRFGEAVSIWGNRAAVGAPGNDTTGADSGKAYVFDLSIGAPTGPSLSLDNPTAAADDKFGSSVAISTERVVVSAPDDDAGASNAGAVHVFLLASPATPEISLLAPTQAANDRFGNAVAISGIRVVVGAALKETPTDAGRVYSFNLSLPVPGTPSATNAKSSASSGDLFGSAVAVDGVIMVIGTPSDNKTANDKGAAYIFGPSAPEIAVEHGGSELTSGDEADFGAVAMGAGGSGSTIFTILNTGITGLAITDITTFEGNAGDFQVVTQGMTSNVPAEDDTTFTVVLNPTAAGLRTTTLRIANGDADENPFEIQLKGFALSAENDTDGDGLNDVAELRMESLGFRWQLPDPGLVAIFQSSVHAAGFHPPNDIGSIRVRKPSISQSGSGFRLSLALDKELSAGGYQSLPFTPQGTTVNPAGEVEFEFSDPGGPAFYKLEPESP